MKVASGRCGVKAKKFCMIRFVAFWHWTGFLVFAIFLCLPKSIVLGEQSIDATKVMLGMIAEREAITTVNCRIRGLEQRFNRTSDSSDSNDGTAVVREINENITVDYSKNLLRREYSPDSTWKDPLILVVGEDKTFVNTVNQKTILIKPREKSEGRCWDVRTFGMASYDDLREKTWLYEFEATFKRHLDQGRIIVESTVDDILLVSMLYSHSLTDDEIVGRRRIWIDVSRGHTPVRMEEQFKHVVDGRKLWKKPHAIAECEWELMDGVWVPKSCMTEFVSDNANIKFILSLDWISAGSRLDDELFTLSGLDIPAGSHTIVDRTIEPGADVITYHPRISDADALRSLNEYNNIAAISESSPSFATLIFVCLVPIVLGLLVWIWSSERAKMHLREAANQKLEDEEKGKN
jgi:hypothetical protein